MGDEEFGEILQGFFEDALGYEDTVRAAIGKIETGDLQSGLGEAARPLHTIKGGAGFIGLRTVHDFVHTVESLLKAVQKGEVEATPPVIGLLVRGMDLVFALLDDTKQQTDAHAAAGQMVLAEISAALDGKAPGPPAVPKAAEAVAATVAATAAPPLTFAGLPPFLAAEQRGTRLIVRLDLPRMVLPQHYEPLAALLFEVPPGLTAALDLTNVRLISSKGWNALRTAAVKVPLAVFGAGRDVLDTFRAYGFDRLIRVFPDEASFMAEGGGGGG